ncbi:MAG: hypothetical protein WCD79_05200 [Chthoniobacteraceae bacterium]
MKILSLIIIWLTLWVDLCLIAGVIFTGVIGVAALIKIGEFSIDSKSQGSASLIVFIVILTAALAISGLHAQRKARIQKVL